MDNEDTNSKEGCDAIGDVEINDDGSIDVANSLSNLFHQKLITHFNIMFLEKK